MTILTMNVDSPALQLILALQSQQATLERNLPTDSRLVATLTLTTGTKYEVLSAYATEPDMVVFTSRLEGKTVAVITRYDIIAEIILRVEKKGKHDKRAPGFHLTAPPDPLESQLES